MYLMKNYNFCSFFHLINFIYKKSFFILFYYDFFPLNFHKYFILFIDDCLPCEDIEVFLVKNTKLNVKKQI